MTIILIIIGIVAGMVISESGLSLTASVIGGVVGFLAAYVISLSNRVHDLTQQLKRLKAIVAPEQDTTPTQTPAMAKDVSAAAQPKEQQAEPVTPVAKQQATASRPLQSPASQQPPVAVSATSSTATGDNIATGIDPVFVEKIRKLLFGGNTVVRVGIIILFFGLSFLVKYATEHNKLPIEVRLIGISFGAIVMLLLGWRLRLKREAYALAMQGGAIAVLYLTTFSALRMYQLIPAGPAFFVLFALAAFSAALAVLQNSRSLAIFGISGGFLAPILTSTGHGSHVMLFSYYGLLNLGIFAIAWFKAWRALNILGFVFTFGIASLWGVLRYSPEFLYSTEPFLILYFLFYVAIAVLFATRQKPELLGYVDGTLVFGVPIAAFVLQYGLIRNIEYGLAFSALVLGLFYIALGSTLIKYGKTIMRDMSESFLAIGIIFGSFAVPLAMEGRVTAAIWALEGAGLLWIGLKQCRLFPRVFGILLQIGASISFLVAPDYRADALPVLNSNYLGYFILALSLSFAANRIHHYRNMTRPEERVFEKILFIIGSIWWFAGGLSEIHDFVGAGYDFNVSLVFIAASSVAAFVLSDVLAWRPPKFVFLILLPVMVLSAVVQAIFSSHPLEDAGYLSWPLAIAAFYWMLRQSESVDYLELRIKSFYPVMHIALLWTLLLLVIRESDWWIRQAIGTDGIWYKLTWVLIPGVYLLSLNWRWLQQRWPLTSFRQVYAIAGATPLVVFLWLWALFMMLWNPGKPDPLPFVPVLNPMDLTIVFVFLVLAGWFAVVIKKDRQADISISTPLLMKLAGISIFLWLNSVMIRTLHYWAGIELKYRVMMNSVLVQASLSLFWGFLALVIMVLSSRKTSRAGWFTGAGLLGLTVAKLFVVDLKNSSNLEAIGAFIGVGILAMVIGYFSPLPPKSLMEKQA